MALQQDYTRKVFGEQMAFKDCYFRVTRIIDYNKEEGCAFDITIYRNKDMSDARGEPIDSLGFRFPYNPNNKEDAIAECYAHLKKLGEFKTSVDC